MSEMLSCLLAEMNVCHTQTEKYRKKKKEFRGNYIFCIQKGKRYI